MSTICFCNSTLAWGGGEKWHLDAAMAMAARGRKALLLCHPKGALFARAPTGVENLRVVPLPLGRTSFLNPLLRMRLIRFFRQESIDALIMNLPADLKAAGPAAKAAGIKRVIYRRGSALPVRDSLLNRYLYGKVISKLIVNSDATRSMVYAHNQNLIPPDRVVVLPNGIAVSDFDTRLACPSEMVFPWEGEAPAGARPLVLGNAGRLNRQKGQHLLIHLGKWLEQAGQDFRLVIAGEGERGEELKGLAKKLGLEKKVYFTGFLEDMSPFWQKIDLFVLTSLWEGFGYVLLEAMLAKKPVLAFRVSNIPELIREGENGRLFALPTELTAQGKGNGRLSALPTELDHLGDSAAKAGNYAWLSAMGDAIIQLAGDPAKRTAMGQAGRSFALRGFSQETCMDRLEEILDE
jgi:glycosyltransferase involved in cell wall biosynthesis